MHARPEGRHGPRPGGGGGQRDRRFLLAVAVALSLALVAPAPALALNRYVDDTIGNTDLLNSCTNPANPCQTIGFALGKASAGETVFVGGGTYNESVTLAGGKSLAGLDFFGNATDLPAIVDGGNGAGITVPSGSARAISALTLRGGDTSGGALTVQGDDVTISGNVFDDNTSTVHRQLLIDNGSPLITGNQFIGVSDGIDRRAIVNNGNDAPEIADNSFSSFFIAINSLPPIDQDAALNVHDNEITGVRDAGIGTPAGLQLSKTSATITNNLISADPAATHGNGVLIDGGDPDATSATLHRNRIFGFAGAGVQLGSMDGPVSLDSDVMAKNGRGLFVNAATGTVIAQNVTVTGSNPTFDEILVQNSQLTLDSSIVGPEGITLAGGGGCTITFSNLEPGGTPPSSVSCGPGAFSSNLVPGYVDPAVDDYHLTPSSPLIEQGNPAAPPGGSTDLDGEARALDGDGDCVARRDIGADELVLSPPPDCTPPETTGTSGVTVPAGGTTGPQTDTSVTFRLSIRRSQRVGKQKGVLLTARCPLESCKLVARGKVTVPGAGKARASKRFKLRSVRRSLAAGVKKTIKVRVARKLLGRVRRSLRRHRKLKARITVTVKDAAGNIAVKRRTVRLRP
jgi:hypothetical protein